FRRDQRAARDNRRPTTRAGASGRRICARQRRSAASVGFRKRVFPMPTATSKVPATTTRMGMAEALRDAMRIAMRADPNVFLIGEDIGVPGGFGGGFTVTLGLSDEFGRERVIDMPISEGAIVGAAVGAAMAGVRPVAEMQYGDFVFCAMDQVVNQAAKMHYMS